MAFSGQRDWQTVIHNKGWLHITVFDKEAGANISVNADLTGCEAARWCLPEDFPHFVLGVKCKEVPWDYSNPQLPRPPEHGAQPWRAPEHKPHVVYVPQRTAVNVSGFARLHRRFLEQGIALKYETAASTPNLQIAMILVAGSMTAQQQGQQTQQGQQAQRPSPCLYGYFLPFKPNHDVRSNDKTYNAWLERRLGERRGRDKDKDVWVWKNDKRWLDGRDARSGMPEEMVTMYAYHYDCSSSQYAMPSSSSGALMHPCLVQSVLPDRTFTYSLRPWRQKPDDATGVLEPDLADTQDAFLAECNCGPGMCGKLRAREELKRLRNEGVQYHLEVRVDNELHGAGPHGELGVYAAEDIPENTYLFEYVGEWLPKEEVPQREQQYGPAGLHYLYDLRHRYKVCREDKEHAPYAVDATHLGNVARFVNHRCEGANLTSVNVCNGGLDYSHQTIMMRTTRAVRAGEKLSIDYQEGLPPEEKAEIKARPEGSIPCRCGADNCLGVVFPLVMRDEKGSEKKSRRCTRRSSLCARGWSPSTSPSPPSSSTSTNSLSRSSGTAAVTGNLVVDGPVSGISGLATKRASEGLQQDQGATVAMVGGDCCVSAAASSPSRQGPALGHLHKASAPMATDLAASALAVSTRQQEQTCRAAAGASFPGDGAMGVAAAATATDAQQPNPAGSPGVRVHKRIRLDQPVAGRPPPDAAAAPAAETATAAQGTSIAMLSAATESVVHTSTSGSISTSSRTVPFGAADTVLPDGAPAWSDSTGAGSLVRVGGGTSTPGARKCIGDTRA